MTKQELKITQRHQMKADLKRLNKSSHPARRRLLVLMSILVLIIYAPPFSLSAQNPNSSENLSGINWDEEATPEGDSLEQGNWDEDTPAESDGVSGINWNDEEDATDSGLAGISAGSWEEETTTIQTEESKSLAKNQAEELLRLESRERVIHASGFVFFVLYLIGGVLTAYFTRNRAIAITYPPELLILLHGVWPLELILFPIIGKKVK